MMFGFASRKLVLCCPYCLQLVRIEKNSLKCPDCKKDIPDYYKLDYKIAPPLFVPIIGWTSVGKTLFLQALTLTMEKLRKAAWPDFVFKPANEPTMKFVRRVREEMIAKREVAGATQLGIHEAYIMVMTNMVHWGGRTLVLRDCAGENFREFTIPQEQVPFLLQSRTTFLMLSLADLAESMDRSMEELLHCYVSTLLKYGSDVRRDSRKIIVVLSKADKLRSKLPENLLQYLLTDPFVTAFHTDTSQQRMSNADMVQYLERMRRASDAVREWIETQASGTQLVGLAKDMNIDLRFSLISSTGTDVLQDRPNVMAEQLQPYRVLDPLFWALQFHSS